ncbi:NAD-dependent epimerase/dehydratase family protein [Dyadobacter psychrotolerans]|uniref:NAD(P)-dependent oxidoreductase n=1 Tax=Dyadobacter psychrotolerans TaxID=2541721 RepID=A0A4V6PFP3_9BACT|nr:NAD(P)-dependent oxidoreductase [Dyadobacter psychrotolerans]TDE11308.1 NAD(P)-dependent oxidoreductase [Dyadobacter psychrotolerans]
MSERVLITGASGFIGQHLVQVALEKGFEVHAAVRPSSEISNLQELGNRAKSENKGSLVFVNLNFGSEESLLTVLEQGVYSYIIHAAGATRAKSMDAYNLVNADYTLNLAKAAISVSVPLKRFVFLSSLAAVGPIDYDSKDAITEQTLPKPVTSYGKSKQLAENYLSGLKDLPLTIIRPTAVYGPGEKDILILFQTLNKGLDLYIGKDPQRLSFVYVKDLVAATFAALSEQSERHNVYNISDGKEYDRYKLADLFKKLSIKNPVRIHLPLAIIELTASLLEAFSVFSKNTPVLNKEKINELTAANWYCSIDAARNRLKYEPEYNLEKGLAETLSWYKENNWL